eukprot:gene24129-27300_t
MTTNLIGWAITIFVALSVAIFFAIVVAAEVQTPVGLSDYKCYGFFRECGVTVCIDVDETVAAGVNPLPALSTWKECTLESTVKLESKSCIYDQLLYYQSDRTMGYDVCQSAFNQGVYVFEDTFENWSNTSHTSTSMRSARWGDVINGFTSDACGVGNEFGERRALVFRGEQVREAVTLDVDISSGGKLEYEMFMPSIEFGLKSELCRTAVQGSVYVEYSIDQGGNWTQLAVYDPLEWRSDTFFLNSIDIPPHGVTAATRFRFRQAGFSAPVDNWALDNVRVLRMLPTDWKEESGFRENVRESQSMIQRAQCCLDTDWCEKRYTAEETQRYCPDFFWYKGEKYLIRLSEILLCFACLLNVLKFLYVSVQDYYLKSRYPFQDEILEIMSLGTVERWIKKVPLRYRPRKIIPDEYTANIHRSARMEEELRKQVADEEGQGDMLVKQEVIERERHAAQKKIKKAQKKLEARKKGKNFKASTVEQTLQENL